MRFNTRTFGGPKAEDGMSVIEPSHGNLAVLGTTQSYGAGKSNIFLLQPSTRKKSDVCITSISPIQKTPDLTVAEPSLSSARVDIEKLSESLREQKTALFE